MTKRGDDIYGPQRPMPSHWGADWTWYALRVEPQRELAIEAKLTEGGWHARVPIRHVWFRRRPGDKRKVLAARAQYVGYVFIGFGPGEAPPWADILAIAGILGVVGHGMEPVAISEPGLISMLAGMRRPINYVNAPKPSRRRKPKSQNTAEIVSGPYLGEVVRVVEVVDDDPELFRLFRVAA